MNSVLQASASQKKTAAQQSNADTTTTSTTIVDDKLEGTPSHNKTIVTSDQVNDDVAAVDDGDLKSLNQTQEQNQSGKELPKDIGDTQQASTNNTKTTLQQDQAVNSGESVESSPKDVEDDEEESGGESPVTVITQEIEPTTNEDIDNSNDALNTEHGHQSSSAATSIAVDDDDEFFDADS